MENMRAALAKFHEMATVPAVVAGVVDRSGVLQLDAVGIRSIDRPDDLATVDDQVHIGSCGKAMTSALYARLVEAGLAEWGTPVASLFSDVPGIDAMWGTVTIDDLLQCRAGVAPNPPLSEMKAMFADASPVAEQRSRAARRVLSDAPNKPGTFVYSNLGYIVAGAAIDRISDMTFEEAMRVHVVEPLAMGSFGYGPTPAMAAHRPKLQLGPLTIGRGKPRERGDIHGDNPPLLTPAGRYHLTIEDWATFVGVFLRDGDGFLTPETVRHLTTMPDDKPRAFAMGWGSAAPFGSLGMQGSNTMWSASILIDDNRERAAMVVANDGRSSVLRKTALLANGLLDGSAPT